MDTDKRALAMAAIWFAMLAPGLRADQSADLLDAARRGKKEDVAYLLKHGTPIEAVDKEGRTPLMLAAQYGHASVVRFLLDNGAKADARDKHGWNAYMLALIAPSGGVVVHTAHESVLKLLPQPARLRVAIDASWSPGKGVLSSCFLRPQELTQHLRDLHPDGLVVEAFQRYAVASGHDLIGIVHQEIRGMAEVENTEVPEDADAIVSLRVEPGAACVQQLDQLSLSVRVKVLRKGERSAMLEEEFGGGVKVGGMRSEFAANPNQYPPLYEAWAKSQARPVYWAILTALMRAR